MPVRRGPGRPKAPLRQDISLVTRSVRRLVDEAHEGNLRQASQHSGVPYGTLRDLYAGRSDAPALSTLHRLAAAYSMPLEWFLHGEDRPPSALTGILPPDPELGRGRLRRIAIPLAAWPLARLFLRLEPYLLSLPAGPARPILAGAGDADACRQRLTGFLLAPLIEAQAHGLILMLGAEPCFRGTERVSSERRQEWNGVLCRLGAFWTEALADLLRRAERRYREAD